MFIKRTAVISFSCFLVLFLFTSKATKADPTQHDDDQNEPLSTQGDRVAAASKWKPQESVDQKYSQKKDNVLFPDYSKVDLPYCGSMNAKYFIDPIDDDFHLEQVQVVLRHGDRITWMERPCWPHYEYFWNCTLHFASMPTIDKDNTLPPGSPMPTLFRKDYIGGKNLLPGNCNYMQLTKKGLEQHIRNGKEFREIYVHRAKFLQPEFTDDDVFLRSTDKPRTIQTLQGFLMGLYGNDKGNGGEEQTQIMMKEGAMIDIFTVDYKKEELVPNNDVCPMWGIHKKKLAESEKWMKHDKDVAIPTEKKMLKMAGFTKKDHMNQEQTYALHDCMMTHVCHSFPLPKGVSSSLFMDFHKDFTWKEWSPYFFPSVEEASKIGIGSFVKILASNIDDMINNRASKKMFAFAGHDTTIMPLLAAFRIVEEANDPLWTPYASALTIELYRKGGDNNNTDGTNSDTQGWFVRFIYNGQVARLSFCDREAVKGGLCPIAVFKKYVSTITFDPEHCHDKGENK
eukprot:Nk52_evm6s77 gene=Nk52_evmTU6s77